MNSKFYSYVIKQMEINYFEFLNIRATSLLYKGSWTLGEFIKANQSPNVHPRDSELVVWSGGHEFWPFVKFHSYACWLARFGYATIMNSYEN